MGEAKFKILFYLILAVIAILTWTKPESLYLILISTGLLTFLFADFISKNKRFWFRGWRLFMKPHVERRSFGWDFYTPAEYFGEKGGKIFTRICGSIILIAGILVLILN